MTTMTIAFNQISEKPRFIFKPNPLNPLAYQICECGRVDKDYEPVGDYIVLDSAEDKTLTEKKVANLISLMNGRGNIMGLNGQAEGRLLYQVLPKENPSADTQVIFRTHDGTQVSIENALLKVKGGIFND